MIRMIPLLLFVMISQLATAESAKELELRVLNAGEGQALLLRAGGQGLLIDTGSFAAASRTVAAIRAAGVRNLDTVILTHLHPDHASGLFRVQEEFPKARVMENCHPLDVKTPGAIEPAIRWVAEALAGLDRRCLRTGDRIPWNGSELQVLWPEKIEGADLNRNSLVLQIRLGKAVALVMGDAPREVERELFARKKLPVSPAILVAGHHGAKDTGDPAFLAHVRPKLAVISVNRDNHWGYPAPETIAELRKNSGSLAWTGQDGEICRTLRWDAVDSAACAR